MLRRLHTYRVVLNDDAQGAARIVEFEAEGPESALLFVGKNCVGRVAELLEDGRSLGVVCNHRDGGFWTIRALPSDNPLLA